MSDGGVFINYRSADSRYAADLLYLGLLPIFGEHRVFLDSESIAPGADFVTTLLDRVRNARAVLAVIGPDWLASATPDGRRRIDDPADWIRLELAAAFDAEVTVIPVFTDGAPVPTEADLPTDIARLGRAQGVPLRQRAARTDLAILVDRLTGLFPDLAPPRSPRNAAAAKFQVDLRHARNVQVGDHATMIVGLPRPDDR